MTKKIDQKDFQTRLEMYFFDPSKTHKEYEEKYRNNYDDKHIKKYKRVRFSPLYLLREDIYFCFGKSPGGTKKISYKNFGPANFAGIVLINIGFTNLVNRLFGKGAFLDFAKRYMGVSEKWKLENLRKLRNALEHNNYGLFYRCKECGTKIYFSLSPSYKELIEIDGNWNRPYPSELFKINPEKLHEAFEEAIGNLKKDIEKKPQLQKKFMKTIRVKDWLILN